MIIVSGIKTSNLNSYAKYNSVIQTFSKVLCSNRLIINLKLKNHEKIIHFSFGYFFNHTY
jgi:hypothetical protein